MAHFPYDVENLVEEYANPCEYLSPDELIKKCRSGSSFTTTSLFGDRQIKVNCPQQCLDFCDEWLSDLVEILSTHLPCLYIPETKRFWDLPSFVDPYLFHEPEGREVSLTINGRDIDGRLIPANLYPNLYTVYGGEVFVSDNKSFPSASWSIKIPNFSIIPTIWSNEHGDIIQLDEKTGKLQGIRREFGISEPSNPDSPEFPLTSGVCKFVKGLEGKPFDLRIDFYTEKQYIPKKS